MDYTQIEYSLTITSEHGTVTKNPAQLTYHYGAIVSLTAVPAAGYTFGSWSGDALGSTNPVSITINANKVVTANYNPIPVEITFTGKEMLGRPTNHSISIKVVPDANILLSFEYGTTPGGPYSTTTPEAANANEPKLTVINGLTANTHYYYRTRYSADAGTSWVERPEYSFWTQRDDGSTYTFSISSDSHVNIMLGNSAEWTKTLQNIAAEKPDFEIDLGDTFAMDSVTNQAGAETAYKYQLPFFNLISASSPIFLAPGNHEQQEGWHLDDTGNIATSPPVLGTNAQKKYFINPVPNSFYSGNTDASTTALDGDDLKEDYYSWEWGDALFVVVDPFWYTTTKPFTGTTGGGETSDTGSGDRWDWTLGDVQFNWLKDTLEGSSAKYKFIFAHHMVGGSDDYVRGGANPAHIGEWGGYNENGTTWGWDVERDATDFGSQPVHQILIENQVSAFFHGHDHQYAYEKRDGIVYQSLPSAGFTGSGFNIYTTGSGYTIQALPSDGHLLVTVGPSKTSVDYVQSTGATIAYSYDIAPAGPTQDLTVAVSPVSSGTTNPAVGPHTYARDAVVDVTATPLTGFVFDHWDGACTGTGTCQVTMDTDKTVTAYFVPSSTTVTFSSTELLTRPTDTSVMVSLIPDSNISLYYEYGTTTGVYTGQTTPVSALAGQPAQVVISGLTASTRYYYRARYSTNGGSSWTNRPEFYFLDATRQRQYLFIYAHLRWACEYHAGKCYHLWKHFGRCGR